MDAMTSLPRRLVAVAPALVLLLAGCATVHPSTLPSMTTATPSATAAVSVPTTPVMSDGPSLTAAPEPPVTPTITVTTQSAVVEALRPAFVSYYAAVDGVLQAGGTGAPTTAMKNTMGGTVLTDWTKTAAEYVAKGYKQTGATAVESFSLGEVNLITGTALVDFCANAAAGKVVDASGATVPPADPAKRALGGTASMVYSGGLWRVTQLTGLTPIANCP